MRILIIYNRVSGRKQYREKDKALRLLLESTAHTITWHYTSPDGSLDEKNPNEFDRIIVCGGDGTIKEAVNWIIRHGSTTPLALIPNGTGNVVAQSIGIPFGTKQALEYALMGKEQKIDVGIINDREYFVMAAGIGFDAKVIKNTSMRLKRLIGYAAYVLGFIKSFFNIRPDTYFIKYDETAKTVKAQSIFVSNFFKFFGFINSPDAKINDGHLNIAIIRTVNAKSLFLTVLRMALGTHIKDSRYEYHRAQHIYIHPLRSSTPIQVDGELMRLPYLDIKLVPKALHIIAPAVQ